MFVGPLTFFDRNQRLKYLPTSTRVRIKTVSGVASYHDGVGFISREKGCQPD